jgi:hypothetical protein
MGAANVEVPATVTLGQRRREVDFDEPNISIVMHALLKISVYGQSIVKIITAWSKKAIAYFS